MIMRIALVLWLMLSAAFGAQFSGRVNGVIATLRGANMNTTADQAMAVPAQITAFTIERIVVTNCTANLTLAVGGIYPTTSKGGTAIVANTQVYTALTAATIRLDLTLSATAATTRYTLANVYFALTAAQGSAATCDIYVEGLDLS
jgi:hypothetical protein